MDDHLISPQEALVEIALALHRSKRTDDWGVEMIDTDAIWDILGRAGVKLESMPVVRTPWTGNGN